MIKRITLIIASSLLLWLIPNYSFAQTFLIPLKPLQEADHNDGSPFGHRTPPAPCICEIDTDNESVLIYGYSLEIQAYEIWDAEMVELLFSSDNEHEFIEALYTYGFSNAIVLRGGTQILVGYINTSIQ